MKGQKCPFLIQRLTIIASTDKLIRIILKLQDDMSSGLKSASSGLQSLGSNLTSAGVALTGLTAPLMAAGVAGVKMATDLDTAMRNVQSVGKQTDAELQALSSTFVDMSTDLTKTTDSAVNLANAFYDIQGSGFEGADAMQVLEAATKAASAGLTQTATAAEGITAVLNSYGLSASEAERISDLMFKTVDRGVGSFEELTGSLANVVGVASAMGISFDEIAAATATMSKQGLSFSEATVSMNQALTSFLKPTEEMGTALAELGYSSGQAMIDALGFAGSMEALAEHTGGSTEAMAGLFSNVRGLRAALALTGEGASIFAEDMAAMGNAAGATAESFAIQTQSFEAQWKSFQNTLNAMLIDIGQIIIPVLIDLMNVVRPLIEGFRNLPEPVQKFIVITGMLITVLGPLLIIIGSVISAIGTIGTAITAIGGMTGIIAGITGVMSGLGTALTALTGPIGLLIISLAALKVAWDRDFLGLKTKIQEIPSVWRENFNMLGEIVRLGKQRIIENLKLIGEYIGKVGWGEAMYNAGKAIIQGLIDGIKSMAQSLWNSVKSISSGVAKTVSDAFKIRSPSKVMEGLGKNVVAGFHEGIASMGGIGVSVPSTASSSNMPMVGAGASGGGNFYMYGDIIAAPGTTDEQVRDISRKLGKLSKRRGAKGLK